MYYGPKIILSTGIKIGGFESAEQLGIVLNLPLALMNALGSLCATFFIDRIGRRFIILRSLPFLFVATCVISMAMYLSTYTAGTSALIGNYMALGGLMLYLAFFSIGFSSTVWTVNAEIYPIHLIGTASSLATATNWISNFAVSACFLTILSTDPGKVYVFLILGGFTLAAIAFVYFLLPETKGKPISENVDNILNKRT
jgi:MFS transporter, SP family, solute carrier family 2 (myo-inositol transporter), member 13